MKRTRFLIQTRRAAPLALSALLAATQAVGAQPAGTQPAGRSASGTLSAPAGGFSQGLFFPHSIFERVLQNVVDKTGNVDYVALKGSKELDLYLQAVATADLSKFPVLPVRVLPDEKDKAGQTSKDKKEVKVTESRNVELAFWINAYNAHVLKTLAAAYPINGPGDIKDFDTAKTHVVAGQRWSLRELRLKIVGFDPRALFTLTTGTRGGPLLEPRTYRFPNLNQSLESAVFAFVNDERNVALNRIQGKVTLSDYFVEANDLFARSGDRKKLGGARALLAAYTSQRTNGKYFTTNDYQVELRPADRSLNIKSR